MHKLRDAFGKIFQGRQNHIEDVLNFRRKLKFRDAPVPSPQDWQQSVSQLEQILTQNILPFWYPDILDLENGGYRLNHDRQGRWQGSAPKGLVAHARLVWFFSRLARSPYGTREHLDAAHHGYRFLKECLWDHQWGGFYWAAEAFGQTVAQANKHLYGQAFGLYALTEYAIAQMQVGSADATAAELAHQLFDVLEHYAHDEQHGGYQEYFQSDWSPADPEKKGYLGALPNIKLMNTHLHLLEAFSAYYELCPEPKVRERLLELVLVQSNAVVRKTAGNCTDRYHRNWHPVAQASGYRVSYGHDLENIWLLINAGERLGLAQGLFLDLYRTLFHQACRYGYDYRWGGFFAAGWEGRLADQRDKVWWVQAEALLSALRLYILTQEAIYGHYFLHILQWIVQYQVDWQNGDWHAQINSQGRVSGDKASFWKTPYHHGRSMLKCLDLLLPLI